MPSNDTNQQEHAPHALAKLEDGEGGFLTKLEDREGDFLTTLEDESGDLSEQAVRVVNQIFQRYDKDKDECLDEEELKAFAVDTNGAPFSEEEREEIKEYFDCRDGDQALRRSGFLQIFAMQTAGDPEQTWKDFKKHGFHRSGRA